MENQLIHHFQRTETDAVYMSVREFKQRKYIDLRIYFQSQNSQELIPTKKGITLGLQFLPELRKGLDLCEKHLLEESKKREEIPLQKTAKSV